MSKKRQIVREGGKEVLSTGDGGEVVFEPGLKILLFSSQQEEEAERGHTTPSSNNEAKVAPEGDTDRVEEVYKILGLRK